MYHPYSKFVSQFISGFDCLELISRCQMWLLGPLNLQPWGVRLMWILLYFQGKELKQKNNDKFFEASRVIAKSMLSALTDLDQF